MKTHEDVAFSAVGQDVSLAGASLALRHALHKGSMPDVMGLFNKLRAEELNQTLVDNGFSVDPSLVAKGRSAVFTGVKSDLGAALVLRTDGFGLQSNRSLGSQHVVVSKNDFAAKEKATGGFAFDSSDFTGEVDAARVIQRVMRSSAIEVELLGDAHPRERQSLLMVAGQGLTKGIQGFGFDGISGKYAVPLTFAQVHSLNQDGAKAVAVESVRSSLDGWSKGQSQNNLHDYVLDSVQKMLQGAASVDAAEVVIASLKNGEIERHAGEVGEHQSATLFAKQGLDVKAPSIEDQVKTLGLNVIAPDLKRGQYFGPVVATDHRAMMLKVSRSDLLELPLSSITSDLGKPRLGDSIRVGFKNGVQSVKIMSRHGVDTGVGR